MSPLPPKALLAIVAAVLLLTMVLGLLRVWRGPDLADRMLTAQLFGTTGVALLLVLSELQDAPALRNVALVLALLAVVASVAFVSRVRRADGRKLRNRGGMPGDRGEPDNPAPRVGDGSTNGGGSR